MKLLFPIILIVFSLSCGINKSSSQNNNEEQKLLIFNPNKMVMDILFERMEADNKDFQNRSVVFRNYRNVPTKNNGTVICAICIDQSGKVIFSKILREESTIKDDKELYKFLKASIGYVYAKDDNTKSIQCGRLNFSIKKF